MKVDKTGQERKTFDGNQKQNVWTVCGFRVDHAWGKGRVGDILVNSFYFIRISLNSSPPVGLKDRQGVGKSSEDIQTEMKADTLRQLAKQKRCASINRSCCRLAVSCFTMPSPTKQKLYRAFWLMKWPRQTKVQGTWLRQKSDSVLRLRYGT